jgi:glycosyltransferase involved in cell wall biosynthesis
MIVFSIVIPAKNEEAYLEHCLKSIREMDFPEENYEIIVADNGSTDRTSEIGKLYDAKVLDLSEAQTISAVRNAGASCAVGECLVFLDADCSVGKDWLKRASLYVRDKDISCFGSSPSIPEQATWVEKTWYLVRKSKSVGEEKAWQESTNMFIPKEKFELVGGFDEELETCEDVDISYRLAKHGKIIDDLRIETIHYRDPKTIVSFFKKERWRGHSNFSGILRHGISYSELPSLILPIYVTVLFVIFFISLVLGNFYLAFFLFFMIQLPIIIIVLIKMKYKYDFLAILRLSFLYNVYFVARFFSLFCFSLRKA